MLATIPVHPLPEQLPHSLSRFWSNSCSKLGSFLNLAFSGKSKARPKEVHPRRRCQKDPRWNYTQNPMHILEGPIACRGEPADPIVCQEIFSHAIIHAALSLCLTFTGSCCLKSKVLFPFSSVSSGQAARETNRGWIKKSMTCIQQSRSWKIRQLI